MLTRSLPALQTRLARDPAWSVYALGDLAPGYFEHAEWRIEAAGEPAVLLLYRQFEVPVLFTFGSPAAVASLLDEVAGEPACYLSIRPEILPLVQARFNVTALTPMWRMTLAPADFQPVAASAASPPVRLGLEHLPALETLFADGQPSGEVPDFFSPAMLSEGIFFGLFESAALVAAAGTHLVVPEQRVAAIGNVYTRRDRRGRGLAAQVTSSVAAALLALAPPLAIIALSVSQSNLAAQRVYQRLGFRRHCDFYEGLAHASPRSWRPSHDPPA